MKCDVCKEKTATYHSRTNINGRVTEVHLCEDCMDRSHYNPFSVFSSSVFDDDFYLDILPKKSTSAVCPKCETTLSQVVSTGKLGCGECYKVFKDRIAYAINSLNYGEKHIGKRCGMVESKDSDDKITKLKKQLQKLVAEEKYEEAAVLKKEIDALKEGDKNEK